MDDEARFQVERRRFSFWSAWGCGFVAVAALVGVVVVLVRVLGPLFPSQPTPPRGEGQEIVARIESYRDRHGTFPPDLAATGWEAPPDSRGHWHYSPSPNLTRFGLLVWYDKAGRSVLSYEPDHGWVEHPVGSD